MLSNVTVRTSISRRNFLRKILASAFLSQKTLFRFPGLTMQFGEMTGRGKRSPSG
jgi:hypothetical protein